MDYAKTLHPSSFLRNPLCLSVFQGAKGTNSPFITLHHPSSPFNTFQLFAIFRFRLTDATTA